jgi:hypothetical protein
MFMVRSHEGALPVDENLRYSIEIGTDLNHLEEVVARIQDLSTARAVYDLTVAHRPEKFVALCHAARVLRRSDEPRNKPQHRPVTRG